IAVSAATALGNGLAPGSRSGHRPAVVVVPNFLTAATAPDDDPTGDIGSTAGTVAAFTERLPRGEFIVFVGDLRPMKGLDVLLAAYEGLDDAPPLVLIGK